MSKRYVAIWFRYLKTDWFALRDPGLHQLPFVLTSPDHGRMVITSANAVAQAQNINSGMVVADARAITPSLQVLDDNPALSAKLLKRLAEWCIRYTPAVAIDLPDGLIADASGCAHLWGGEDLYLNDITTKLKRVGFYARIAIADSIGAAWAIVRFGKRSSVIENDQQATALFSLPPEALRIDIGTIERLHKLGLRHISQLITMPRSALRRRFGQRVIQRLHQALGLEEEILHPVQPIEPYQERLPCLESIMTAMGIEIAIQRLLEIICKRLKQEQKGLRKAVLKCFRSDGRIVSVEIGTNRPSNNMHHLFKLFELKVTTIEPEPGIDLFMLEAQKVEAISPLQEKLWQKAVGLDNIALSELIDRIAGKFGADHVHRYVPDEHYWPERSVKKALSLHENLQTTWKVDRPRPLQLLSNPEPIKVTAPVPDYPPMNFRYKGNLHTIIKANGPERIEQEWWLQQGQHRDYYYVEDEEGKRYWLFRLGHYADRSYQWFIHGFFA